jgi:hypothetical protein
MGLDFNVTNRLQASFSATECLLSLRCSRMEACGLVMGRRRIPPEIAADLADHFIGDALTERDIEVLGRVAGAPRTR